MNIENAKKSLENSIIIFLMWTNFDLILTLIECVKFCFLEVEFPGLNST